MTPDAPNAGAGPIHTATAGIQARLRAVFPPAKFQHELLAAPLGPNTIGKIGAVRAPLVALAFLGFRPGPNSGRVLTGKLRFGIYLLTSNPKPGPRLLGDVLAPGLAQMIHVTVLGVNGWTIAGERDSGVGTIALGDMDALDGAEWAAEHQACATLTAEVLATFTGAEADDFLRLAATWTFDGPTDAAADLTERAS